jgi:hypothetical protein
MRLSITSGKIHSNDSSRPEGRGIKPADGITGRAAILSLSIQKRKGAGKIIGDPVGTAPRCFLGHLFFFTCVTNELLRGMPGVLS